VNNDLTEMNVGPDQMTPFFIGLVLIVSCFISAEQTNKFRQSGQCLVLPVNDLPHPLDGLICMPNVLSDSVLRLDLSAFQYTNRWSYNHSSALLAHLTPHQTKKVII
jgi:hypothetical protein